MNVYGKIVGPADNCGGPWSANLEQNAQLKAHIPWRLSEVNESI